MRSARVAIYAAALLLIVLPLALLLVAYGYERWIFARYERALQAITERVARGEAPELAELGRREGVRIRRLDARGGVMADSGLDDAAVSASPIGSVLEAVLGRVGAGPPRESLSEVDQALGPLAERPEVKEARAGQQALALHDSASGQIELFSLASPVPDGGVVHVTKAWRRGVRRLLTLQRELAKLVLYQAVFAVLVAALLVRWLVRPLERLAAGANQYPGGTLAGPELLARRDELGQLARSMSALAASLEQRRKATADLAADLAHELKNPLATIAASAELIASTQEPTLQKREMVQQHIQTAVDRLRMTTDELLGLVRLEAALPNEPRQRVEYAAFLEGLVDEYRRDPRYAGFTLRAEIDPAVGAVSIVPAGWARLLRNLLDNALVQPMERREVIVRAERSASGVITSVRDHGPGISPGNRDKIFRRFFTHRPEGAPTGTGLGLSIVQTVAEAHGGHVEVDSAPGEGATFRVTLPD